MLHQYLLHWYLVYILVNGAFSPITLGVSICDIVTYNNKYIFGILAQNLWNFLSDKNNKGAIAFSVLFVNEVDFGLTLGNLSVVAGCQENQCCV